MQNYTFRYYKDKFASIKKMATTRMDKMYDMISNPLTNITCRKANLNFRFSSICNYSEMRATYHLKNIAQQHSLPTFYPDFTVWMWKTG